jgi:hypothetical protein
MSPVLAGYRCPDCGAGFQNASSLTDHALTAHVEAPTRAAHIRRPRWPWLNRIGVGLAMTIALGFWTLLILAGAGVFDKADAPKTPGSVVHEIAVDLKRSGAVDEFRAVEPDDGWDTEYEFDDGEGYLRIRDEGRPTEEVEYEAFGDDLYDELDQATARAGFLPQER